MKLFYISPRDVRKNRADPVYIMKSCDMFAKLEMDVTLVTPRYFRRDWKVSRQGVWQLYGLTRSFVIRELPTFLTDNSPSWLVRFQKLFWFAVFFLWLAIKTVRNSDTVIIYSKCYISTLPAIVLRKFLKLPWRLVFEKAGFSESHRTHAYVCKNVDGIVAINSFIAKKIVNEYKIPEERVLVKEPYCDINHFKKFKVSKAAARKKVDLPANRFLAVYTGKLYYGQLESKYIIEAAALCPDKLFVLVGAREPVIKSYEPYLRERNIQNVILRGFQPFVNLYYYIQSADVLMSYYDNNEFSAHCRVPSKLGIYTCAERPIILADLPGMRYLLNENQAFFVKPDSPKELAKTIDYVAQHKEEASEKAREAYKFPERNDIMKTGRRTLEFVQTL